MSSISKLLSLLIMGVLIFNTEATPQMCNETSSITFDPSKFAGIWYEVARNPAPSSSFLCAQINFTLQANNLMDISTTYSVTPLYPYVNQTMTASVALEEANNPYGYNLSYVIGQTTYPLQTFKLLDTDYSNYAILCGYENFTNNNTYFNIVLTRVQLLNSSILNGYEQMAAQNFSGFDSNSLTTIVQEETCMYYSGVVRSVPALATICSLVLMMLAMLI